VLSLLEACYLTLAGLPGGASRAAPDPSQDPLPKAQQLPLPAAGQ
jgi:hypothetical protein